MSTEEIDDIKDFLQSQRIEIITRVQLVAPVADHLLKEKVICQETYNKIRNEKSECDKMRDIYNCLSTSHAFSTFHRILQEQEPHLFNELREKWSERKLVEDEESSPVSKKRRQMAGDITDSLTKTMTQEPADGINAKEDLLDTIEEMDVYLDNPKNRQRIVNELRQKLKEGEVKKLEDFLSGMKLKKVFRFNHDVVKNIISCTEIKEFLKPGNEKRLSGKVIKHFFESVRGSPAGTQNRAEPTGTDVALEISDDNMSDNGPLPLQTSSPTSTLKLSVAEENKRGSTPPTISLSPSTYCSQTTSPFTAGHCAVATTDESLPVANSENPGNRQSGFIDSGVTSLSENQNTEQPSETHLEPESNHLSLAKTPIKDELFTQDANTPSQNNVKESSVGMDSPDIAAFAKAAHKNENKEKVKRLQVQVQKKKKEEEQKKMLLFNWARQSILADKQGTSLEEELGKIRDGISIVNIREYKQYPCLVCECCMVFTDPQTGKQSIIEVPLKEVHGKRGKLNSQTEFKLQFNMGMLKIHETILLLQDKTVVVFYDGSFDNNVKQFRNIIDKVFIPVLALFKELQRKTQLF